MIEPATIAHIGIAVTDLEAATAFYRDVLGVIPSQPEQADGARIVHLELGGAKVELLEPIQADSPIGRFIDRRGPGLHHICYRVPDIEAALAQCQALGYGLIDQEPRSGASGCRVAFLHPKSTHGVLIELTE